MRSNDEPLQLWVLTRLDYVTNSNILSRIFAKNPRSEISE